MKSDMVWHQVTGASDETVDRGKAEARARQKIYQASFKVIAVMTIGRHPPTKPPSFTARAYFQFSVRVDGASEIELYQGHLAALEVFEHHRVMPVRAAYAAFAWNGDELSGFDPTYEGDKAEDAKIAYVWREAERAAQKATCTNWAADRQIPIHDILVLRRTRAG